MWKNIISHTYGIMEIWLAVAVMSKHSLAPPLREDMLQGCSELTAASRGAFRDPLKSCSPWAQQWPKSPARPAQWGLLGSWASQQPGHNFLGAVFSSYPSLFPVVPPLVSVRPGWLPEGSPYLALLPHPASFSGVLPNTFIAYLLPSWHLFIKGP